MDFTDKVAVVSGGSGGIGFASAVFILDRGGAVVAGRTPRPLSAAQRERVSSHGDRVLEIACDVTRMADAEGGRRGGGGALRAHRRNREQCGDRPPP